MKAKPVTAAELGREGVLLGGVWRISAGCLELCKQSGAGTEVTETERKRKRVADVTRSGRDCWT